MKNPIRSITAVLFRLLFAATVCSLAGCDSKPGTTQETPATPARTATIAADPNPVPTTAGQGRTIITWNTGTGADGTVYVAVNGEKENLFAKGPVGAEPAPWIATGSTYVFRLRSSPDEKLLGEVTVSPAKE
jgi:ABC-type transport system substrate-binding protein